MCQPLQPHVHMQLGLAISIMTFDVVIDLLPRIMSGSSIIRESALFIICLRESMQRTR